MSKPARTSAGGGMISSVRRAHRLVERDLLLHDHLRQNAAGKRLGYRSDLENLIRMRSTIAEDTPLAMIKHTDNEPSAGTRGDTYRSH
jgi:hypothetical protein